MSDGTKKVLIWVLAAIMVIGLIGPSAALMFIGR
jgi:hypothetical protein